MVKRKKNGKIFWLGALIFVSFLVPTLVGGSTLTTSDVSYTIIPYFTNVRPEVEVVWSGGPENVNTYALFVNGTKVATGLWEPPTPLRWNSSGVKGTVFSLHLLANDSTGVVIDQCLIISTFVFRAIFTTTTHTITVLSSQYNPWCDPVTVFALGGGSSLLSLLLVLTVRAKRRYDG